VKLSGNFLMASAIEALGEAVALIGKAGIDRHAYVDLLTSSIFNAPVYKIYGGLIAQGKFEPAAFAAPLGYKDIRLAAGRGEKLRVPMPLEACCTTAFCASLPRAGDHLDWSGRRGAGCSGCRRWSGYAAGVDAIRQVSPRNPHACHSPNRAEPALYVYRGGIAHFPHRHARGTAYAGRYFSEHQYPDHRRGPFNIRACRPTRWPAASSPPFERALTTTVNDIEHFEANSYTTFGIVKIYFHPTVNIATRQRAGHRDSAELAQADAARHDAATSSSITAPRRCRSFSWPLSGKGLTEQNLADLGVNFVRPRLVTVQGAGIPWPFGGKSPQVMFDLDTAAPRGPRLDGARRRECTRRTEPHHPGGLRKDR